MARGSKDKKAPSKDLPGIKEWFEEAWQGWIKPIGAILLLIAGYLAYDRGLIHEGSTGILVVVLIVGGIITTAGFPVLELLEKKQHRLAFGLFLVAWAVVAGYAPVRRALPGNPLAEPVQVAYCPHFNGKECADPVLSTTANLPGGGPYEVTVDGELKGQGQAESTYHLTFAGADNSTAEVDGKLERRFWNQRTSRRGSGGTMVKQERTEEMHRVPVSGNTIKITADGIDDSLENGLSLTFRNAGPNPLLFVIACALFVVVALVLDYRLAAPKVKTYLTMAAAMTLVFAWDYPTEATPHFLVRPAVGALFLALCAGGLPGWLTSVVVKSFKPKPKKG